MNTAALAQNAYSRSNAMAPEPRDTEYRAFAMVTRKLSQSNEDGPTAFPRLAAAIHENQVLWGCIAADVAGNGNGLPEKLRAQVFYLAEYTRMHSRKVLSEGASPDVLIEINTAIMRGLRARQPEVVE